MQMKRSAWAPAHISALFSLHTGREMGDTGSIGAGFCLAGGVTADVDVEIGPGRKTFRINGEMAHLPVTETAVSILESRAEKRLSGTFDIHTPYPASQGFGISAAGTLATSLAVSDLLSLPDEEGWLAAHSAEIVNRTGLGDVVAEINGGGILRIKAGLPAHGGEVARFRLLNRGSEAGIIAVVMGGKLRTDSVLGDPALMEKISVYGRDAVDSLSRLLEKSSGSMEAVDFSRVVREFALKTGLVSPQLRKAFEVLDRCNMGEKYPFSMVMLGNALFFLPPLDAVNEALDEIKTTLSPIAPDALYITDKVGNTGAHLID